MRLLSVNMIRQDGNGQDVQVPAMINLHFLRTFYPRRENNGVGTRLTFCNGTGFAVAESFDEIKAKAVEAGVWVHDVNMVRSELHGTVDLFADDDASDDLPLGDPAPADVPHNPACINLAYLRAFYPRHQGVGTRLTFQDGKGFAVTDAFADIQEVFAGLARPN